VTVLSKVLVIGDAGVGKTSFIKQLVYDIFSTNYKTTVGADFYLKTVEDTCEGITHKIQLWDFGSMMKLYCKNARMALILMDVSNPLTIEGARGWVEKLDKHLSPEKDKIPYIFIVNEAEEDVVYDSKFDDIQVLQTEFGFGEDVFFISSKLGTGFQAVLTRMVELLTQGYKNYVNIPKTADDTSSPTKVPCCDCQAEKYTNKVKMEHFRQLQKQVDVSIMQADALKMQLASMRSHIDQLVGQ
jgi:small GTP-binding protein